VPSSGGMPAMNPMGGQMSHAPMQPGSAPMQRAAHAQGQQPGPGPNPAAPTAAGTPGWMNAAVGPRFRISGQILLLAIVGIICLGIFITGIILFATTKF
jgi:hypothetical protein